jgi:hypothetical protein
VAPYLRENTDFSTEIGRGVFVHKGIISAIKSLDCA